MKATTRRSRKSYWWVLLAVAIAAPLLLLWSTPGAPELAEQRSRLARNFIAGHAPWVLPGTTLGDIAVIEQLGLGKGVEALRVRRSAEEYLLAFVSKEAPIEVLLMGAANDFFDGFPALEERLNREGRRILWAMNGGMYHADRRPVGLLVSGSQLLQPLNTSHGEGNFFLEPNGVFALIPSGPAVMSTRRWQAQGLIALAATQSGPLLLADGQLHPAFEPHSTYRAVRNAVGVITGSASVIFAISTTRVTFFELATLLGDLGCRDALYLDGNVSSLFAPKLGRRDPGLGLGPVLLVSEPRQTLPRQAQPGVPNVAPQSLGAPTESRSSVGGTR
jgi:uncharacterized protein YigE (DUF2233 family)